MIKGITTAAAFGAAACLARSEYEKKQFSVEETCIRSDKILKDKTLVFLSDLHNNEFGPGNRRLLEAIRRVNPDAVLIGGDMMVCKGRRDVAVPLELVKRLAGDFPVYYGNGNHENRMVWEREIYGGLYEEYRDRLKRMGVIYLENGTAPWGADAEISGLDLGQRYYRKALFQKLDPMPPDYLTRRLGRVRGTGREEKFQILLAHSPMYFKDYGAWGADLTLSGHFHGGTIRIPGLGGVMTPQYQFFIPWCAGDFEADGKRMIVSRGLGTHSINIRLNNRPQLAVVRLKKQ